MPNETPGLTPLDEHNIFTEWQGEGYHKQLDGRESAYDSDTRTENMFEISDGLKAKHEAQAAKRTIPVFEAPAIAQPIPDSLYPNHEAHLETVAEPGEQLQLPPDLLPAAVSAAQRTISSEAEENKKEAEAMASHPNIPESVRPAVQSYLEEVGSDWNRLNSQAQTTSGAADARSRAKIETEEDRSDKEIMDIKKRAGQLPGTPAHQIHKRIKKANIKRRYPDSGPSDIAKGEI